MAKKIKTTFKINLPAGGATPAPPVGPVLGQHGVPIMDFVKQYNDATADKKVRLFQLLLRYMKINHLASSLNFHQLPQ